MKINSWNYSDFDFDIKSSDRISSLKEKIRDKDSRFLRGEQTLYHKERELLDNLLVKDYAVEAGDTFEIKEKDTREVHVVRGDDP